MIPETAATNQLYLYRCISFPNQWERKKILMDGVKIYDATVYKQDDYFYLFCSAKKSSELSSDVYLHIYYTKDLLNNPFVPHPSNPVYRDARKSRPAGNLFSWNGKLLRPVQNCTPLYGNHISFMEVSELTPENFQEKISFEIHPDFSKKIKRLHTFNSDGNFNVADVQYNRFKYF
jgi:hypothetical protein